MRHLLVSLTARSEYGSRSAGGKRGDTWKLQGFIWKHKDQLGPVVAAAAGISLVFLQII
jgi:hypothetical protein